jgi:nucleotide-binding universal stress UspA family protein
MPAIRTILHPTDFSEHSDYAFGLACALARDYGARLLVLHVATRPVVVPIEGVIAPEPELYQEEFTEALHKFQEADPALAIDTRLVLGGDPATEIVRAAGAAAADLIVLGTHGRKGVRRFLMGSVAEAVLRQAACPVLTVKAPYPAAPPSSKPVTGACRTDVEPVPR